MTDGLKGNLTAEDRGKKNNITQKWPNALSERAPNVVGKKLVKAGGEDEMQERVGKKARRAILAGEGEGRGERGTYQPYERGTKKQRIVVTAPPPAVLHGRKEPLGPKNDSRYQESAKNKGRGKADRNPTKTLSPQQKGKGKEQQGEGKGKGLYKKGSKGADLKKEVIKTPAGGTEKEAKNRKRRKQNVLHQSDRATAEEYPWQEGRGGK